MAEKLQAVKGMNDILPGESERWEWLEAQIRAVMRTFAYSPIRTPIVEHTQVFVKGTGATTDIVEKEMYAFEDRLSGEHLTLRPENTPGVVRAAIEHNLTYDGGKRLYYYGPMFRHEKPQRGRYRQFYQLGVECLGFSGPEIDAETMILVWTLLARLGLRQIQVQINSLGLPAERAAHRDALVAYLGEHAAALDADSQRRLLTNPLRILDSKNPAMQAMIEQAPRLIDHLSEASRAHFSRVQELLSAAGVPWVINPRLVRGLDYYCHTVFEFVTDDLGAQGTVCGGGRYDGLSELLGGKPMPGVGWGMGLERVLDLMNQAGVQQVLQRPDVFAVVPQPAAYAAAMPVVAGLRAHGLSVQMHASGAEGNWGSMKSQMKKADASGAGFALIFGDDELVRGEVTLKSLRDAAGGAQQARLLAEVDLWAEELKTP